MTALMVTRSKGRETDEGDFEFIVTVPYDSLSLFHAAFPGFKLFLAIPEDTCSVSKPKPPSQGITTKGHESFESAKDEPVRYLPVSAYNELMQTFRLPTFQSFAAKQSGVKESTIGDSDEFALFFIEDITDKKITELNEDDCRKVLNLYLNYLAASGKNNG
jgi:hypothetical protein